MEELRDFYEKMHTPENGCTSVHVPTWNEMLIQHIHLCCELEVEYKIKNLEERLCSRK